MAATFEAEKEKRIENIAVMSTNLTNQFKELKQKLKSLPLNAKFDLRCETTSKKGFGNFQLYKFRGLQISVPCVYNGDLIPVYFTENGTAYIFLFNPNKLFTDPINHISWTQFGLLLNDKKRDHSFLLSDVYEVYGTSINPNIYIVGDISEMEEGLSYVIPQTGSCMFSEESLSAIQEVSTYLYNFKGLASDYLNYVGATYENDVFFSSNK